MLPNMDVHTSETSSYAEVKSEIRTLVYVLNSGIFSLVVLESWSRNFE